MKYDFTHLATKRSISSLGELQAMRRKGLWERVRAALGLGANATYGYLGGYVSGTNVGIPSTPGAFNVAEIELDFAAIALLRTAAAQTALAAADILQLFSVPAGVWVPACFGETLTVEGETATYGIGDGSGTSGFIATADANALSGVVGSLVTSAYSVAVGGGKIYAAADTIDMILNTAAFNVSKIRVMAVMVDLRAQR